MAFLQGQFLAIVAGQHRGLVFDLLRGVLRLLSGPYYLAVCLRNAYYGLIGPAARKFPVPVISVGNITVGGTGKTPLAAHVANLLIQRRRKVAVLLRGYKGLAVQFGQNDRDLAAQRWRIESDEALVLERRCPRARILADPDRVAGARQAIDRGCDALVLDDGFQHRRMGRSLDIVLIDATAPFGYGHVLPRGLLREPLHALRRAHLIVLTRSDAISASDKSLLLVNLKQLSGGKPILQARHRIVGFTDVKGRVVYVDDPTVMQAVIFAGIGNFEGFRHSVEQLGVHVLAAYEYPDHHAYTNDELAGLRDVAASLEANVILTTEKDAVRLLGRWSDDATASGETVGTYRLLALQLDIEFDPDSEKLLHEAIDRVLLKPPA